MEQERPQLSVRELHQVRWLLGGLLALVAVWSVCYLDVTVWPLLFATTLGVVVTQLRPSLPGRWPGWVHKLAFPGVVSAFAFDYYTFGELLPALVRLAMLLLLYRVCNYRKRRDDLQLILLGLFLVITTGVLTVAIGFAFQIVCFTVLALALLFVRTLVDAAEVGRPPAAAQGLPDWVHVNWPSLLRRVRQVSDWRVLGFSMVLFAGLVLVSALLFVAIPRFQLESSLFLDRWMNKRSVTGFSDTLRFGEVSDIQKDESVAFRVEVSDPSRLPNELYWRMAVLDEYRDHAFRMSPALRTEAFGPPVTRGNLGVFGHPLRTTPGEWTFYVEPGVSRYLPLPGSFRWLLFMEPQNFRASGSLRVIELTRDPATMKAYRIGAPDTTGIFPESARSVSGNPGAVSQALLAVPFSSAERARLQAVVQEITQGRPRGAVEFTHEAIAWLHRHHTYSLQSTLPKSEGDPLLRWMLSEEPGHCELFAGAFAMLARTAGFPTRVAVGFLGAAWNGDYLIVRNSNAHAWCEIFDGEGAWHRVDPTVPPVDAALNSLEQTESALRRLQNASGWSAQLDRIRMLWYRHIVNFDRRDQYTLIQSLKQNTAESGKQFRDWLQHVVQVIRAWLRGPWPLARFAWLAGPLAGAIALILWWRQVGFHWWISARSRRARGVDPVRREAGRWLARFARRADEFSKEDSACAEAVSALQRLRYGSRASWPEPVAVFQRARAVFKKRRQRAAG